MIRLAGDQHAAQRPLGAAAQADQTIAPLPQVRHLNLGRFTAVALQI